MIVTSLVILAALAIAVSGCAYLTGEGVTERLSGALWPTPSDNISFDCGLAARCAIRAPWLSTPRGP
jgi:hypothetical protein